MSILDFTTNVFRDPANLRSFVDDPNKLLTTRDCAAQSPSRSTTCFRW